MLSGFGSAIQPFNVNAFRDYVYPEHYIIQKSVLKTNISSDGFYANLSTCTLFYAFYNITMDMCQYGASKELYHCN